MTKRIRIFLTVIATSATLAIAAGSAAAAPIQTPEASEIHTLVDSPEQLPLLDWDWK
ncbi:hypothetical protein ACIGB6_00945 [Paeniglutamicibacter gangotriensis]|uniref:Uncharacterized protein n=1 Tax=Paeniglutamicibacter gangotriensis Lz1y TaxID=1276920 RepID=M7NPG0_9MICC|nr:hypothetical protein [Paeniglutamicibacter gangotriensis]EMR00409.1 hypothetical protein ADIAG_00416 [Paeniglutamicibacter gangotriensis Lz1y]